MPKDSLEFAAQLYKEQKKALQQLNGRDDDRVLDEIYDSQKRYDDCARELATVPAIVNAIPDLARNEIGNDYFKSTAWHVVYLSKNLDVLDELLTLSHSKEVYWPDLDDTVHCLQDKEADVIINHLKTKGDDEVAWLMKVAGYIESNRREAHLDLFIRDNKLRYPGFYYTQIAYFNTPECVRLFKEMAEEEGYIDYHPWLLQLQITEGWDSIKAFENIEEEGTNYALYGSPKDLPHFIAHIESLPIEERAPYVTTLPMFGSVRVMTWLFGQLNNSDEKYRMMIHFTMCKLFYPEIYDAPHPDFDQIINFNDLLDDDDEEYYDDDGELCENEFDPSMLSSEYLKKLWTDVNPTILSLRDPDTRYRCATNKPFDFLEMLREVRYASNRSMVTRVINRLIIYTGEFFPFDELAYFEKQQAQLDVWEQFLEENRDQFLPGRWVRWGKYID